MVKAQRKAADVAELTDPSPRSPAALEGLPRDDQLLDLARGRDSDAYDRAIDVQISRLRRKLDDGGGSELIRTIRSEGYMFTAKVVRTP